MSVPQLLTDRTSHGYILRAFTDVDVLEKRTRHVTPSRRTESLSFRATLAHRRGIQRVDLLRLRPGAVKHCAQPPARGASGAIPADKQPGPRSSFFSRKRSTIAAPPLSVFVPIAV
ncbi:unnamed protein product [Pleuronectes platessa]|uniref:Uncharacterized protein n=1 Tax=Pleuronectes platessa TaxID=8262 RepID=A0A9N7UIH1_PLEPL|nr:unnamed protein product [Pleuronectes platessa]